MKLDHIPHVACPTCQAKVKDMRRCNQHSNGHWNESIEFDCGARIEWSPNIGGPNTTWLCPKDPEAIKTEEILNIAYRATLDTFEAQDLPGVFKMKLRNDIHVTFHNAIREARMPKYRKG